MSKYRAELPQANGGIFLSYLGMETDLIFNRGVDLPGFAAFPLVETDEGRSLLREYFANQIELAARSGVGVMLESPTWMANRDRGGAIGYTPEQITAANVAAIKLMSEVRTNKGDLPTILSGDVGPRGDAYAPTDQMTVTEAASYHAEQIEVLATTEADLISAFTLCYAEEAAGIALAAKQCGMPVAISFTVEIDGRLPTGMDLGDAVAMVDGITDNYPAYFLINCAHPDHFTSTLNGGHWMERLRGLVVNASRCSHAELDDAEELDDGNPNELGRQLGELKQRFPQLTIFGGCCGTDLRHMSSIADNVSH